MPTPLVSVDTQPYILDYEKTSRDRDSLNETRNQKKGSEPLCGD